MSRAPRFPPPAAAIATAVLTQHRAAAGRRSRHRTPTSMRPLICACFPSAKVATTSSAIPATSATRTGLQLLRRAPGRRYLWRRLVLHGRRPQPLVASLVSLLHRRRPLVLLVRTLR